MTLRTIFRFTMLGALLYSVVMITLLLAIYVNQRQIEEFVTMSSLENSDLNQASVYVRMLVGMVVLLLFLLLLVFWIIGRRVRMPVRALLLQTEGVKEEMNRMTDRIIDLSMGNLDSAFEVNTRPLLFRYRDEFSTLAEAHNAMIDNLKLTGDAIEAIVTAMKASRDKLRGVNEWLEKAVEERTLELTEAHRELSKLDQAKSSFLRMISHEIRTPLNGIQGFMYLMKGIPQTPDMAEIFDLLQVSVERLERFSQVALMITELQTGRRNVDYTTCTPCELIDAVTPQLQSSLEEKGLKVVTDRVGTVPALRVDRRMIEWCLRSILENAVTYSFPNGLITVSCAMKEAQLALSVSDEGRGFSERSIQNLFRMFIPGEEHIDENVGLDLALAKLIMEAHGGEITVANRPEGGACVTLLFPI